MHVPILILLLLTLLVNARTQTSHISKNMEIKAAKGTFLVHMLHSAYFFPQTVEVKWSAFAHGRPDLPVWLHLFRSKHKAIAYLIGTPVTPLQQVTIHIIARRIDTYESADQLLTIILNEDARFNTSTQQVATLAIKNVEAEEFTNHRSDKAKRLERAIHETFRGKQVNPYIFNVQSEVEYPPSEDFHKVAHKLNIGSIVEIGTQHHFHQNVLSLLEGLKKNPHYCRNNNFIPLDKHFNREFTIDWCAFDIRNVTMIHSLSSSTPPLPGRKRVKAGEDADGKNYQTAKMESRRIIETMDELNKKYPAQPAYSFWESVLVFPLLAAFCILLVLVLSLIFFGRREGQQWRDFKTPKEQLQEYLSLRESQRHLRELSVQRQMLLMADTNGSGGNGRAGTPVGINTFLQPVVQQPRGGGSQTRLLTSAPASPATHYNQLTRSNTEGGGHHHREITPNRRYFLGPRTSIGKQTVAEAAKETGSSLRLYRNPLQDDEDGDNYGTDSEAEGEQQRPKSKY